MHFLISYDAICVRQPCCESQPWLPQMRPVLSVPAQTEGRTRKLTSSASAARRADAASAAAARSASTSARSAASRAAAASASRSRASASLGCSGWRHSDVAYMLRYVTHHNLVSRRSRLPCQTVG